MKQNGPQSLVSIYELIIYTRMDLHGPGRFGTGAQYAWWQIPYQLIGMDFLLDDIRLFTVQRRDCI